MFYVPAYNGGLFRTDPDAEDDREARFLARYEAGDSYVARVIELLTRSEDSNGGGKIFVDYSSLDVRHLGSIYEGILEYDIDVADEALTLDDGEYVSAGDGEEVIVEEGELYLLTDVGERKATGSYYTPEYVVEYIVENTLRPLVEEICEDLVGQSAFDEGGFAAEFAERVFDLKILDPAMGSGHFLTSAVDYLAREIVDAQERQAEQQGIETVEESHDINWARRQVAQKCIYGVDLNPLAVELAKVSLWLRTLAAKQPLAFLDHHLKTGNSLIGSDIEGVDELKLGDRQTEIAENFENIRKRSIDHVMDIYQEFITIENTDLADAKEMERKHQEIERDALRNRLVAMANVKTAEDFGLELPSDAYERMAEALDSDSEWANVEEIAWYRDARRYASASRCFHWKLEYPEAFYEADGSEQDNPGFDAVIGNQPYFNVGLTWGKESARAEYIQRTYADTWSGKSDILYYFVDRGIELCRNKGNLSYITSRYYMEAHNARGLREKILDQTNVSEIIDFGGFSVFEEVGTKVCITTLQPAQSSVSRSENKVRYVKLLDEIEDSEVIFRFNQTDGLAELFLEIEQEYIEADRWNLKGRQNSNIAERIDSDHPRLGDISEIGQGMQTGANDVFVVNNKT